MTKEAGGRGDGRRLAVAARDGPVSLAVSAAAAQTPVFDSAMCKDGYEVDGSLDALGGRLVLLLATREGDTKGVQRCAREAGDRGKRGKGKEDKSCALASDSGLVCHGRRECNKDSDSL